jgi:GR25 family glycosyltransferase involved in LPS biosynthesis
METVYVINMARSRSRWSRWAREARVDVHRIDAVDGRHLEPSHDAYFRRADFANRAAKGCALSHLKAMKTSLAKGDTYAVICEDDVILNDCFDERLQMIKDALPDEWDVVFLTREENKSRLPFSTGYDPTGWNFTGTSMYMISNQAMRRYVDHVEQEGFGRAIDWDLIDFVPHYLLHPVGTYTLDGTTTVQNETTAQPLMAIVVCATLVCALAVFLLRR